MATPLGIDLGNVMRAAETIKSTRALGEMRQRELEEDKQMQALRKRFYAGDKSVLNEMMVLNPREAAAFHSSVRSLSPKGRKRKQADLSVVGRALHAITTSENPEETYANVLNMLPDETRAFIEKRMPNGYNADLANHWLAQTSLMHDILDGDEGGKGEKLDRNQIGTLRKIVSESLGFVNDGLGAYTGGSEVAKRVNKIVARSAELVRDGDGFQEAANKALAEEEMESGPIVDPTPAPRTAATPAGQGDTTLPPGFVEN